jgi:hypothetical protein
VRSLEANPNLLVARERLQRSLSSEARRVAKLELARGSAEYGMPQRAELVSEAHSGESDRAHVSLTYDVAYPDARAREQLRVEFDLSGNLAPRLVERRKLPPGPR